MVIFYIAYVAFFVVVIVYAALSGSQVKRSFCYFSQIPYIAIVGTNNQNFQFIGLNNIKQTMTDFSGQVLGFSPYLSDLTAIKNLNLPQSAIGAENSVTNLGNYYQGRTIKSPIDNTYYVYPELFLAMDNLFMGKIQQEFYSASNLSKEIDNLAVNASNIVTAPQGSLNPQENIQTYTTLIDNIIVRNSYYFSMLLEFINYMMKYKKQYIGVLIAFISFCLILHLIFVIVIYNQNVKGKCYDCQLLIKLFIILMVLLTVIVFLITVFFYVFSMINSTACNISTQFLNISDFSPFFSNEDFQYVNFLNSCIGSSATGNSLNGVYNNYQFAGIAQIVQGLYNSQLYQTYVNASNGTPQSTSEPLSYAAQALNGTYTDPTVTLQLEKLNGIVSCANIVFSFIGVSTSTEKSVLDAGALSTTACYTYSDAESVRALLAQSYPSVQTVF